MSAAGADCWTEDARSTKCPDLVLPGRFGGEDEAAEFDGIPPEDGIREDRTGAF